MIFQFLVARKQKNMSQREVADIVGISTAFYSMIENGKRKPSIDTLKKIQNALSIEKIDLREF